MSKSLLGWLRIEYLFKSIASLFRSRSVQANNAPIGKYSVFTKGACEALRLANEEAMRSNDVYIGTEHLLLSLVQQESGIAAKILRNHGVDTRMIRLEAETFVPAGPDLVTMNPQLQTPRMKVVVDYAIEEAFSLNHNHVGTEHLLLGLLRENEGVAAHVLINLGFNLDNLREEVHKSTEVPS